jgi:Tfp pilus assembly protein PilO
MPLKPGPKLSYQKKIMLTIVLFLSAAAASVYFLILPAAEKIKKIKLEVAGEQLETETAYWKGKNLRKLAEGLKTVESRSGELGKIFIKKENALEFITALEKTAEKNGVIQKTNMGGEEKLAAGENNSRIPIQLSATGDFASLINYLNGLESLSYYINIKSLAVSLPNGQGGPLAVQIIADTYWQN